MSDAETDSDFLAGLLHTNRERADARSGTHAEHESWLRELIRGGPPGSSAGSSSGGAASGALADAAGCRAAAAGSLASEPAGSSIAVAARTTASSFAEAARGADALRSDGSDSGEAGFDTDDEAEVDSDITRASMLSGPAARAFRPAVVLIEGELGRRPAAFKIGICTHPVRRWRHDPFSYVREGVYAQMVLLLRSSARGMRRPSKGVSSPVSPLFPGATT